MFLDSDDFLLRNALQAAFFENEQLAKDFGRYSTYHERSSACNGVFAGLEYLEECVRQGDFISNACMQLSSYPFLEKHGIRFSKGSFTKTTCLRTHAFFVLRGWLS